MSATFIRETGESVTLDATFSVSVTGASTITEHPVEVGASSSDHSQPRPIEIQINGKITETPIVTADRVVSFEGVDNRLREVFAFFESVRLAGEFVTAVLPKFGSYENMAIASTRPVSTNVNATAMSIDLRQVRLAERITVQIPPLRPREDASAGLPDEQDVGQKATEENLSENEAGKASIAYKIGTSYGWL